MPPSETRLSQLRQIPLFALRKMLIDFAQDSILEEKLLDQYEQALGNRPSSVQNAIEYLTREQVNSIVNIATEITDSDISSLFEQYRYGQNPSFRVYRFKSKTLSRVDQLDTLESKLISAFEENDIDEDTDPKTKTFRLNDFEPLPGQPEIIEGNFRFLQRLDYINSDQFAVSTYKTIYGFFWICVNDGYIIIHPQRDKALSIVKEVIEQALDIQLLSLRFTEEFKKSLNFIDPDKIRSGSVYDPRPDSPNMRYMTFRDDEPHKKGLSRILKDYPEAPIARYRETIDDEKETTYTVSSKGILSIYGRLSATQFRGWALASLKEVIASMNEFQDRISEYVETLDLNDFPEFKRLDAKSKKLFREIVVALLTFKRFPDVTSYRLTVSPLRFAQALSKYVNVQIPYRCPHRSCDHIDCFKCPICENRELIISDGSDWRIECSKHRTRNRRWTSIFPLTDECDSSHSIVLGSSEAESAIEIFFGTKLLQILQDVVHNYFDDYSVDFEHEVIYISGHDVLYHADRRKNKGDNGVTYIDK